MREGRTTRTRAGRRPRGPNDDHKGQTTRTRAGRRRGGPNDEVEEGLEGRTTQQGRAGGSALFSMCILLFSFMYLGTNPRRDYPSLEINLPILLSSLCDPPSTIGKC